MKRLLRTFTADLGGKPKALAPRPNLEAPTFEQFQARVRQEWYQGSAIDPSFEPYFASSDVIEAGGTCRDEVAELLNWDCKQAGFSRRKARFGTFLLNEDGTPGRPC